jgi:hypothetical protein
MTLRYDAKRAARFYDEADAGRGAPDRGEHLLIVARKEQS